MSILAVELHPQAHSVSFSGEAIIVDLLMVEPFRHHLFGFLVYLKQH